MPHSSTARRRRVLAALILELRHALRALVRDRAFSLTAVGMLTLALALNVAAFMLMSAMLYRGYPLVERNDQLLYIQERGALGCCVAYGNFEEWRAQATSFEGLAFVDGRTLTLRDANGGRERLSAPIVSPELFGLLGVKPTLGRDFVADDAAPGAPPVAILSHRLWERRYGGRADVIGESLETEAGPLELIGVMPEGFSFPEHNDLWTPVSSTLATTDRAQTGFLVVARLKAGVSAAQAEAELETIAQRLAEAFPETNRGVIPEIKPHAEFFFGDEARTLYGAMWLATWFVLLIACANLANLSVARTMSRAHELSTRLALGAGHWRMGRQILIESLLLAGVAGACAWWLATWSIATYARATASVHYVLDFSMGRDVLAYLAGIALGAGVLFALVPIVNLWRIDVSGSLKGGARGTTPAARTQAALIVGQMIFAVVLLSGSGVLVRSFMQFENASLGIDRRNVLAASIELPRERYADSQTRAALLRTLDARLETIVGVELAATTGHRPLAGAARRAFEIEAQVPAGEDAALPTVSALFTGPEYFRAVGAAILEGRDFADSDQTSGEPVAIVNQRFAATHWVGANAIGKRVRLSTVDGAGEWHRVVGVAANIMQTDPTRQTYAPLVYLPHWQTTAPFVWALVRTAVEPSAVAAAVRREILRLDPDIYVANVEPLEELIAFNAELMDVAHQHLGRNAVLFPIFAASALLLAAVGLYAVVAHSVGRRTREIGVRIAIGATATQIWRWVLGQAMAPVVVGLVAGLVLSLGVNRVLRSQLIGVEFYDPLTLIVAPLVLMLVGLLACRIPARRAMRVDPVAALRRE